MFDPETIQTIADQLKAGDIVSWRRSREAGFLHKGNEHISPRLTDLRVTAGQVMGSMEELARAAGCKVRFLHSEGTKDLYELHT